MLIIREVFTAKPGQASKLAKLFKSLFTSSRRDEGVRVLTDLVGSFNTVVLETEVESLAEFEKRMQSYMKNDALARKLKGYTEMYQKGYREIYRVM